MCNPDRREVPARALRYAQEVEQCADRLVERLVADDQNVEFTKRAPATEPRAELGDCAEEVLSLRRIGLGARERA